MPVIKLGFIYQCVATRWSACFAKELKFEGIPSEAWMECVKIHGNKKLNFRNILRKVAKVPLD